jgi:ABC-type bacteriocin/lantibiotic exporter with double-glycine peptidase domain
MKTATYLPKQSRSPIGIIKHFITSVALLAVLFGSVTLTNQPNLATSMVDIESVQQAVTEVITPLTHLVDQWRTRDYGS